MKELDERMRQCKKREKDAYRLLPDWMLASQGEAMAHQCLALCFTTGNFVAAHQIVLHAGATMYGVPHALSWAKLLGPFAAYGG